MLNTISSARPALDTEACWSAVQRRDKAAERDFVFAVVTTGVFCRPACAARTPKRENVRFFHTVEEAQRAGFRPCKRCKPLAQTTAEEDHAAIIAELCRQIEAAEEMPTLAELADMARLSAFHLHRMFKRITGVTPKAYMAAVKAQRMRAGLPEAGSVTEAIYEAGFSSSSRFYEKADGILGMSPARYKRGGQGIRMVYAVAPCWLGLVLVAATERGLCAILFDDDAEALAAELRKRFPAAEIAPAGTAFAERLSEVLKAIDEPRLAANLPLDIVGTAFQQRIWRALREIPAGRTASYAEIARHIGAPKAVRAVAGACAANPIAVAIPCHRVIRGDGDLAGYRWGLARKRGLLAREAAPPAKAAGAWPAGRTSR
jgi:AraC family transcriptional regulator, regulatory protein of adaptative response / methylated-DNA-[protein]-cysteine methyltransferase